MFQGSESLEKLAHFRHVQSSGGVFNGSTHQDYTDYFEVLPAAALERALFLEADRLRAPDAHRGEPAQPGRRRQGGDPAQRPQPALRRVPLDPAAAGPLRHVPQRAQRLRRLLRAGAGLASTTPRRSSTPTTRRATRRSRSPATSDVDEAAARWSRSTSATSRPARRPPARRSPSRRRAPSAAQSVPDAHAPLPALAVGYRLPDPGADLDGYLGHALLGSVLGDGEAARLQRRLVHADGLVTDVSAGAGLMGPLDARDPDTFTVTAVHPRGRRPRPRARPRSTRSWTSSPPTARTDEELRRQVGALVGRALPGERPGDVPHARPRRPRAALRPRRDRRRAAGTAGRRHPRAGRAAAAAALRGAGRVRCCSSSPAAVASPRARRTRDQPAHRTPRRSAAPPPAPAPLPAARRHPRGPAARRRRHHARPTGLRVLAAHRPGRPDGRAAPAGAVRRRRRARRTRPSPSCSPRPCSPAPRPATASRSTTSWPRSAPTSASASTRSACWSPAPASPRACPTCWTCSPTCSPPPPTPTRRSPASATGSSSGSPWPARSRARSRGRRCSASGSATTRSPGRCRPAADVAAVTAEQVRALHAARRSCRAGRSSRSSATSTRPPRSPTSSSCLGGWTADARGPASSRRRRRSPASDLELVHRPGSVQSQLRLTAPASAAADPATPRCSWPTWSSAATSPRAGWRTSARTRATPTARTPAIEFVPGGGGAGRGDRRGQRRHRRRAPGDPLRAGPARRRAADGGRDRRGPRATRSARC